MAIFSTVAEDRASDKYYRSLHQLDSSQNGASYTPSQGITLVLLLEQMVRSVHTRTRTQTTVEDVKRTFRKELEALTRRLEDL